MSLAPPHCPSTVGDSCLGASCRPGCALEVIDQLLGEPGVASGQEIDLLLDLRWLLHEQRCADAALAVFCDLRRRMESRHYLAFFRLRRWLEHHVFAVAEFVRAAPVQAAVRLDRYCPVAIRRLCVCAVLRYHPATEVPRISFVFRLNAPLVPENLAGESASSLKANPPAKPEPLPAREIWLS